MKFHKDVLNGFHDSDWIRVSYKVPREMTEKLLIQKLWFLCSTCLLIMKCIYVMLCEDALSIFSRYRDEMIL